MIEIKNITKYYGDFLALDNVSFLVPKGHVLGFLGPNGAGKTTTMRILTCYITPTSGTAEICGFDILKNPQEVKKRVGYLPEMNPLYSDMDVIEYLEFISNIRHINGNINKRIKEVVNICRLNNVLEKNIGELSRGYRQRVGFAQAIIHNPEVLIMDEPTAGLDPNQANEVRELIKELKKEKTVILSTHILSEVQAVCDSALIINKGKIIASGTTSELRSMVQGKEKTYIELKSVNNADNKIKTIPGVENVVLVKEENNNFTYMIESTSDIRESVFNLAVTNGWTIIELHREFVSLEEIFRKLTVE
jgi:ABC-2 type transport system ATP-binding protein